MLQNQNNHFQYKNLDITVLNILADKYQWISEPIARASEYVASMPFFKWVASIQSPLEFKSVATQLFYHSATFPKVMGLMLGNTPLHENHMMKFYSEHAFGEATHHELLMKWMLKHDVLKNREEIKEVITSIETNACINLAYQLAIEQDRDKWLVAINCGIERCSNDFFKAVAPKMHALGVGDVYFDIHVEADEHHSIMGLEYLDTDRITPFRKETLVAKALEGISLWAAMIHSWINIHTMPIFDLEGKIISSRNKN